MQVFLVAFALLQRPLSIGNGIVERRFETAPYFRTVELAAPKDGWTLKTTGSEEFAIELDGGRVLTSKQMQFKAARAGRSGGRRWLVVELEVAGADVAVQLRYEAAAGQAWMRKIVVVRRAGGATVLRIDVEDLKLAEDVPDQSGLGYVMVAGRAWFGAEYPATRNSIADCRLIIRHYPGRKCGRSGVRSKVAVWGVARKGQTVQQAFWDYLDTVAIPARDFLHYNSWYDLRGREVCHRIAVEKMRLFKRGLLDPYGIRLAAFVLDDNWQDRGAGAWIERRDQFPNGLEALARDLESLGTRLGLWMPLSGFGLHARELSQKFGFELADGGRYFCLAAPKWRSALKRRLAHLVPSTHLAYFKHDFNFLRCRQSGHEHLPTPEHGFEANVNRTLEMLDYERSLQRDIFLNVTSGMWYSPWWLMHADAIWGAFPGDTGHNRDYPLLTLHEQAISFRDVHLYRMYRQRANNFFPISRLMTHGIVEGRYNRVGGQDYTLWQWADYVVIYFARGVQMKELYISPELMDADKWRVLAQAIRWAQARRAILERTVMIGGNPAKGEVYGFAHCRGERCILALRNPAPMTQEITVRLGPEIDWRGRAPKLYGMVVYPAVWALNKPWQAGREISISVPPRSVMIVEFSPRPTGLKPLAAARPAEVKSGLQQGANEWLARVRAEMPPGTRRLWLIAVARGPLPGPWKLSGAEVLSRKSSSGPGWQMEAFELRPRQQIDLTLQGPWRGEEPFGMPPGGKLEAYLVWEVDAPKQQAPAWARPLPYPVGQGRLRAGQRVLAAEMRGGAPPAVRASELRGARRALLRMDIFGSQGGQWADKWIIFNGVRICRVPLNSRRRFDQWEQRVVELPAEALRTIEPENTVVFTNESGDCYKVRNIVLAVQLADGRWVHTHWISDTFCSASGWPFAEGRYFKGGRSPAIKLRFNVLRPGR